MKSKKITGKPSVVMTRNRIGKFLKFRSKGIANTGCHPSFHQSVDKLFHDLLQMPNKLNTMDHQMPQV